jgi:hypothetical protein
MSKSEEFVKGLLSQLKVTREDELPCDDMFKLLDIYAEAKAKGEDPSAYLPTVKHHLEMCRDCLEEYEALMAILDNQDW